MTQAERGTPSRPGDLKRANARKIVALLRLHSPCSRADLVRLCDLSAPTVSSAVEYLEQKGLIKRLGLGSSSGGRPPDIVCFNSQFGYVAGVDVGGSNVRIALADLDGKVLSRWTMRTQGNRTPHRVVKLIDDGLRNLFAQNDLPRRKLLALGLGAPGITDVRAGVVLSAPHLSEWHNVPLREQLHARLKTSVSVENDVNTAALGENWCGAAKGISNFVFLAIGTGIGAGIYINNNLYHGSDWSAGEVGYLLVPGTPVTSISIGKPGALEIAIGGPGIQRAWRKVRDTATGADADLKPTEIFELAETGNAHARKLLHSTAQTLANAISNISLLLNTSLIVLGGAIGTSIPLFNATSRLLLRNDFARPRLAISLLGEDAQLLGAVRLALDHVESTMFALD